MTDAYVGIDVAFAKKKRLPVAVCVREPSRLRTLRLRTREWSPPTGSGNRAALDRSIVAEFAEATLRYLRELEVRHDLRIVRVAIDAPRDYAPDGQRRMADRAMDAAGISCFTTPSRLQFDVIRAKADAHLSSGGLESRLPHANQIWMLVGFQLFNVLEPHYDCIEVFPQATFRALDASIPHKSSAEGVNRQIEMLFRFAGFTYEDITECCRGALHDRVDALLSAWIASLDPPSLIAHGDGGRDTIWSVRPTRPVR